MESSFLKYLGEYGPVVLAFGILLFQAIKEKNAMSRRMESREDNLLDAYTKNTTAYERLVEMLDRRKCLAGDEALKR